MKAEYREGPEAREKFDKGMAKLFRVPKTKVTEGKPKAKAQTEENQQGLAFVLAAPLPFVSVTVALPAPISSL